MSKVRVTSLVDMVITLKDNQGNKKNLLGKKSISFDIGEYPKWQECCGIFMKSGKVKLEQEEKTKVKKEEIINKEPEPNNLVEAPKKTAKKAAKKVSKKAVKKAVQEEEQDSNNGRSVKRSRKSK